MNKRIWSLIWQTPLYLALLYYAWTFMLSTFDLMPAASPG